LNRLTFVTANTFIEINSQKVRINDSTRSPIYAKFHSLIQTCSVDDSW